MARKFLGVAASLLSNWVTFKDVAPVRNAKTGAYTVDATDLGKMIECSSASGAGWILSLTAAATLGAGFFFYVKKTDLAGAVSIDPNGSETIDGKAAINLYGGEASYKIFTDGVSWYTLGRQKGWIDTTGVISVTAGTSSLTITPDAEATDIEFRYSNYVPNSPGSLTFVLNTSGGASTYGGEVTQGSSTTTTSTALTTMTLGNSTITVTGGIVTVRNIQATGGFGIALSGQLWQASLQRIIGGHFSTAGAMSNLVITPGAGTISSMLYQVKMFRS